MTIPNDLPPSSTPHPVTEEVSLNEMDDVTPEGVCLLIAGNNVLAESDEMKWRIGRHLDMLTRFEKAEEKRWESSNEVVKERE